MFKNFLKSTVRVIDLLTIPLVILSGLFLKTLRKIGFRWLPISREILLRIGVLPIIDHYYEPLFDIKKLRKPLSKARNLPGIRWNPNEQLEFLKHLNFGSELVNIPSSKQEELEFYFNNKSFESGDAEYLYSFMRYVKPSRIFEIGSGNSTLMAIKAITRNMEENESYACKHLCIEPYEMPWLAKTRVTLIREKVEEMDISIFQELEDGDLLFIDSSHIIRPQGDVLFEYLQILPTLKKGVYVHIHDIFTPRDYLENWLKQDIWLWNEQYLLESFLTSNSRWKIIGALNYLCHDYYDQLKSKCPYLTADREPGSFYMQKED